ncbi:MAG: hypothetical protein QNJ61_07945, partial [Desulfobacterales bacterium]|nr:hypothetical protein [Desulfobacterales bacterium]
FVAVESAVNTLGAGLFEKLFTKAIQGVSKSFPVDITEVHRKVFEVHQKGPNDIFKRGRRPITGAVSKR